MDDSLPKPHLIIFLGAPGSGKGTQSLLLAEKFDFLRIETSKLLMRRFAKAKQGGDTIEVAGKNYSLKQQQERWDKGLLVEASVVAQTVEEKLDQLLEQEESVILDGFPRTVEQMEYLLPFALKAYGKERFVVLYLDIQEEDTVFRNSNRRVCELARHPTLFNEETKNLTICPVDGSKLITRPLDDAEIIKTRLQAFRDLTLPLLGYFKEQGIQVFEMSGEGSVAEVFSRISQAVTEATKA